jgi:CheY-like chemotaxis protein
VLLDINMPGMSGFDFLTAYEQFPANKRSSVVVVMLTSSIDDRDKERALRFSSVKAFLTKPIESQVVPGLLNLLEG